MVNSVEKRKFHCRLLNGTFAASFFNFRLFFLVDSSKYTFIKSSRWLDLNLDHLSTKVTALSTVPQPLLNQNKLFWFLENLRRFPPKNVQSFKFNEFKQGHNHQNFPLGARNDKIEQHRHRGRRCRLADVVQIVFRVDRAPRNGKTRLPTLCGYAIFRTRTGGHTAP